MIEDIRSLIEKQRNNSQNLAYNQLSPLEVQNDRRECLKDVTSYFFEFSCKKKFIVDETNEKAYKAIISYFAQHEDFLKTTTADGLDKYSFDKSLFIRGPYGVAKTDLILAIRSAINFLSIQEKREGKSNFWEKQMFSYFEMGTIKKEFEITKWNSLSRLETQSSILLDDVGFEKIANDYHAPIELFEHIYSERYKLRKRNFSTKTHIITNLLMSDLIKRYDGRIIERLCETSNIITYESNAKSRRSEFLLKMQEQSR